MIGELGIIATLLQWLDSIRSDRGKAEKSTTIGDYLEWLRRHNHQEIVDGIERSHELAQNLKTLIAKNHDRLIEMGDELLERLNKQGDILGEISGRTTRILEEVTKPSKEDDRGKRIEEVAKEYRRLEEAGTSLNTIDRLIQAGAVAKLRNNDDLLKACELIGQQGGKHPLKGWYRYGIHENEALVFVKWQLETKTIQGMPTVPDVPKLIRQFLTSLDWQGVLLNGKFYCYDGPLDDLELKEPCPFQESISAALKEAGYKPGKIPFDQEGDRLDRGYHVIYSTDRHSWRRRIEVREHVLMAKVAG